jgi:4-carboxymuconolactone decarboxylase
MARVKLIQNREDVSPEHYALFDELAALRSRISGPSTVVLHSPGLARPWNQISEFLHGESIVEPAAAELAVSTTARESDCSYIWNAHAPLARKADVSENTIAALRDGLEVAGEPEPLAVVQYAQQLVRVNRVDASVFGALLSAHDARWLVELTAWIGRYAALAGILNAFEVAPPPDAEVLPDLGSRPKRTSARAVEKAPRVPLLTSRDLVAEAAQPVFDAVAENRGSVRGPFAVLLHSPPLCRRVLDVTTYLREVSPVRSGQRELAIIVTAREKDCAYVWAAHVPTARSEGVSETAIAAVRDRGPIEALPAEERDVVDYARQLLQEHRVSQALFDRLRDARGVPWLVDLTALIGHYGFVTAMLNAFEVAPAPDSERLPLG